MSDNGDNIVPLRPQAGGTGGGGDTIDGRVERLEADMAEVKTSLRSIEVTLIAIQAEFRHGVKAADLASLRAELTILRTETAEVKGRVSQMPTALTLFLALISTWAVGTGIVFTLLRFAGNQ